MTEKDFRKRMDKIRSSLGAIAVEVNFLYNDFSDHEEARASTPLTQAQAGNTGSPKLPTFDAICDDPYMDQIIEASLSEREVLKVFYDTMCRQLRAI